jgi:hypothetical protein
VPGGNERPRVEPRRVAGGSDDGLRHLRVACDGSSRTFTVQVQASQGAYQVGIAQALTFANIEYAGETFYGIDDDGALDIVS